jgi:uncharacterized protein (DUF433 family)
MRSVQKSLRIPRETVRRIAALAEAADRDFSSTTNELLEEALRLRRCPGIVFTWGPSGRRATVAGSGIDVWEAIAKLKLLGGNHSRLRRHYHWLSEAQLRAALSYYQAFPQEIDRRLEQEEAWTRERIHVAYPFMRPSSPARSARPVRAGAQQRPQR